MRFLPARHLPEIPWWREMAVRIWLMLTRPRRMSTGAKLAIIVLVLLGIGISAYTRYYVDQRVKIRIAQSCASWGADEVSAERQISLYALLLAQPHRPGDEAFRLYLDDSRTALVQARDTKVDLRAGNECPPYPPPPLVPVTPSDHRR